MASGRPARLLAKGSGGRVQSIRLRTATHRPLPLPVTNTRNAYLVHLLGQSQSVPATPVHNMTSPDSMGDWPIYSLANQQPKMPPRLISDSQPRAWFLPFSPRSDSDPTAPPRIVWLDKFESFSGDEPERFGSEWACASQGR